MHDQNNVFYAIALSAVILVWGLICQEGRSVVGGLWQATIGKT